MHFSHYFLLLLPLALLSVYLQLFMQSKHFLQGLNRFMVSNFHRVCMHVLSGMLRHHHSSEGWESKSVSVLPLAMKFSGFMLIVSFIQMFTA